jgi:hypothetical protein
MTRGCGWFAPLKALALKTLGRCCVAPGRKKEVEGGAGRIHRTIQEAPLALDPDVGFVHLPRVVGRFETPAQTSFHFRGVTLDEIATP